MPGMGSFWFGRAGQDGSILKRRVVAVSVMFEIRFRRHEYRLHRKD